MTYPAAIYGLYRVRKQGSNRIVSCRDGWIVLVRGQLSDTEAIDRAREIYRTRLCGRTLPEAWGKVLKYASYDIHKDTHKLKIS